MTASSPNGSARNGHAAGQTEKLPIAARGKIETLLVDAKEAAAMCSVSPATLWRWDSSGAMPKPVRLGGTTRWCVVDLERWVRWGCPRREIFEGFVRAEDSQ